MGRYIKVALEIVVTETTKAKLSKTLNTGMRSHTTSINEEGGGARGWSRGDDGCLKLSDGN